MLLNFIFNFSDKKNSLLRQYFSFKYLLDYIPLNLKFQRLKVNLIYGISIKKNGKNKFRNN